MQQKGPNNVLNLGLANQPVLLFIGIDSINKEKATQLNPNNMTGPGSKPMPQTEPYY
jgi:hypothetical protein